MALVYYLNNLDHYWYNNSSFKREIFASRFSLKAPVAQWIEQDGSNVKVGGSTPSGGVMVAMV